MLEKNRELVRAWWEAYASHDLDTCIGFVGDDVVIHGSSSKGREGFREELEFWVSAFPDMAPIIEDLIAEGDKVVSRVSDTATHEGDFLGVPATRKQVTTQEIDIFRIEDGRIVEVWAAPDLFRIMAQLGVLGEEER